MKAYVQLIRPLNCIMVAAAVFIGALIAKGLGVLEVHYLEVSIACSVAFLFTGAGNSLNDYYDRDIDRVNHPQRPIPSKKLSPLRAVWIAFVLFFISLCLALFINSVAFLIVVANLAVMLSYEIFFKVKGAAGNLTISWLTATAFLFGGAAVGGMEKTLVLGILAFLATLGREIAKDIEDIRGDTNRNTLPMKYGTKKAGVFASFFMALGVIISPIPIITGIFPGQGSMYYTPIIGVADAIFIYSIVILLREKNKASTPIKGAMLIALFAFLAGGIL